MFRKFWLSSIQASLVFYGITIGIISGTTGCDKGNSKSPTNQTNYQNTKKVAEDDDIDDQDDDEKDRKKSKKKNADSDSESTKGGSKENTTKTGPGNAQSPKPPPVKPVAPPSNPLPTPNPPSSAGQPPANPQLVMFACGSKMTAPELITWIAANNPARGMTPEQFAQIKASLEGVTEAQLADFLAQNCKT